jgi:enamine deaminase RidA (YjgF/YER057c/UK114 family)
MLHDINGLNPGDEKDTDRISQSESMFYRAKDLLFTEGATYNDVVRTWIYISDILDWYDDFNSVRNNCYSEYGFLADKDSGLQAEQIFLPASTGIEGNNPSGASTTMDIFAVHRSPGSSVQIRPLYSAKQLSPFRYGSAFSRAVVVEEPGSKQILVSGTASIDEQGRTLFIGNPEAQIRHTLDIVASLVDLEGASLKDLCEATVFLKHKQILPIFQKILEQMEITGMPSVNVVADVCRNELLFELDAAFIIEK